MRSVGVLVGVFGAVQTAKTLRCGSTVVSYIVLAAPTVVVIVVVQTIFVWIGHQGGPLLPTAGEYDSTLHGVGTSGSTGSSG